MRDQMRDALGGEIGKFTFGRNNYKFKTSSEKCTRPYAIYWHIGVHTSRLFLIS
jgi:hypothetical protein